MKKIVSTMFKCGAICASINIACGEGGKAQSKENCPVTPCSSPVKTRQHDLTKPLTPVWVSRILKQERTFLAEGGQGKVYVCERYALKFLNPGISDKKSCQLLRKCLKSLISDRGNRVSTRAEQNFYEGCKDFITEYFGTYTHIEVLGPDKCKYGQFFNLRTGVPLARGTYRTVVDPKTGVKRVFGIREVSFFEKIDGEEFLAFRGELIQKCQLLAQAAAGISLMHEAGCINTDIKPENMMVAKKEGFPTIKLIDHAAIIDLKQCFSENGIVVSPYYWPPETKAVLSGMRGVSPAFNVYQLGMTAFAILAPKHFIDLVIKKWEGISNPCEEDALQGYIPNYFLDRIDEIFIQKSPDAESKFIGQFLKDCLAVEPENRISSAQAAEILQVFSSYLEEEIRILEDPIVEKNLKEGTLELPKKKRKVLLFPGCPDYEEVKAMAIKDCPKSIPVALRRMLFSEDPEQQKKAQEAIIRLVENADSSYTNTPSYGMALLLSDKKLLTDFYSWAREYPEALQQLKNRTYIFGNEHTNEQDMPVSKEIYDKIHVETETSEEEGTAEEVRGSVDSIPVSDFFSSPETEQSLAIPDGITVSTLFESDISTTKVKSLD